MSDLRSQINPGPDLGYKLCNLIDQDEAEENDKELNHNEMETVKVCIEIEQWFRTYIRNEMPKKQILYYLERKAFKIPISNFFDALEMVKNTIFAMGLLPFRKGTEHTTGYYICQLWPMYDLVYTNNIIELPLCKLSDIKTYCGAPMHPTFVHRLRENALISDTNPYRLFGPHRFPALRKEDLKNNCNNE